MCFRQAVASAKQIRGERKGRVTRAKKKTKEKGIRAPSAPPFTRSLNAKNKNKKQKTKKKGKKTLCRKLLLNGITLF